MDQKERLSRVRNALQTHMTSRSWIPNAAAIGVAVGVLLLFSVEPAAAQEHCSSGINSVYNATAGMVFGYSRPLMALALFGGLMLAVIQPFHPFTSVIGIGIIAVVVIAMIGMLAGIEIINTGFEAMGAPEACVDTFGGSGGEGGDA